MYNNIHYLQSMSYDEYKKHLVRIISRNSDILSNFSSDLTNNHGHSEKHIKLSEDDMLQRCISERKSSATFVDYNTVNKILAEAILENYDKILKTVISDQKELNILYNNDSIVGHGIDVLFDEMETKCTHIKLVPSKDKMTDVGFVIRTAYPEIELNGIPTGKSFLPKAHSILGDSLESEYIVRQAKIMGYKLSRINSYGNIQIGMRIDENTNFAATISTTDGTIKYKLFKKDTFMNLDSSKLILNEYNFPKSIHMSIIDIPDMLIDLKEQYKEVEEMIQEFTPEK